MTVLLMALFGGVGAVCRFITDTALKARSAVGLPVGTLVINVTGSLLLGVLNGLRLRHGLGDEVLLVLGTGFCGGFTTFSSFSLQTLELIRAGAPGRALLNIGLSVVLCLIAVALGYVVAEHLNGGVQQIAEAQIEEDAG